MQFRELYRADIGRYGGLPDLYMRVFLFLFCKVQCARNRLSKNFYRVLYRLVASHRGIEISLQQHIGTGLYLGYAYNITNATDGYINNCFLNE